MFQYFFWKVVSFCWGMLPLSLASKVGYLMGYLYSYCTPQKFLILERRMRKVLGQETPTTQSRKKARQAFAYWARGWTEMLWMWKNGAKKIYSRIDIEGLENLESAQTLQKGIIGIGAHIGSWEIAGVWCKEFMQKNLLAVTESYKEPWKRKAMTNFRSKVNFEIAEDSGAGTILALLRHLHENGLVGVAVDRKIRGSGILCLFFGEETKLPLEGVIKIAQRSGAPLLPIAPYYGKQGRYTLSFLPPIMANSKSSEQVPQKITEVLEHLIRRAPEQWHALQPILPSETK